MSDLGMRTFAIDVEVDAIGTVAGLRYDVAPRRRGLLVMPSSRHPMPAPRGPFHPIHIVPWWMIDRKDRRRRSHLVRTVSIRTMQAAAR